MNNERKNKKDPVAVSIHILGKEYMVSCPAGEQASLISSAKEVDGKMRDIRKSGKIIGSERIAVITSLNLSNELNTIHHKIGATDNEIIKRISDLQKKAEAALERITAKSL
jgi:cell division protein ZapA